MANSFKEDNVKVTITLSKASVDFFKKEAKKHHVQYQKMIRRLLDLYTIHQKKSPSYFALGGASWLASAFRRRIYAGYLFTMNLLMVRHGEILSNLKKVYAGRSPEGLTERGVCQAREVSEKLKGYNVHALYSSPIKRALRTAEIIGETIGMDFVIEDAFREMEMGPWEGLSEKDIAQSYTKDWQIWQSRPAELKLHGRETLEALQKRVLKGVQNIYQSVGDRTIVIVTHVAIIRVLLLWHRKKDLNLYKTIHVPNAGVFEMKIE